MGGQLHGRWVSGESRLGQPCAGRSRFCEGAGARRLLAEAHHPVLPIKFFYRWDWDAAEKESHGD